VGYPYGKKGWQVYDLETSAFLISRDVVFCEDTFPFHKPLNPPVSQPSTADLWTYDCDNNEHLIIENNSSNETHLFVDGVGDQVNTGTELFDLSDAQNSAATSAGRNINNEDKGGMKI
jgi:hypothetical protein